MSTVRSAQIDPAFDEPNFTRCPNKFYDYHLPRINSLAELKVTEIIIRYTEGWNEPEVRISLTQLVELTGLSRPAVIEGVKLALERGTIKRYKHNQDWVYYLNIAGRKDREDVTTREIRSPNTSPSSKNSLLAHGTSSKEFLPVETENTPPSSKNPLPVLVKDFNPPIINKEREKEREIYSPEDRNTSEPKGSSVISTSLEYIGDEEVKERREAEKQHVLTAFTPRPGTPPPAAPPGPAPSAAGLSPQRETRQQRLRLSELPIEDRFEQLRTQEPYASLYKDLNLEFELKRMRAWCAADPQNRRPSFHRFVNWLNNQAAKIQAANKTQKGGWNDREWFEWADKEIARLESLESGKVDEANASTTVTGKPLK